MSEETINKASLFKKMAAVMGRLSRIPKTGHNTFHHYDYATESDIADAVRRAMAEEGIAFFINMVSIEQTEEQVSNKPYLRTRAVFEFTFACGETGATQTNRWEAEALDNSDKGINKVATAAEKYFLLKTFIVSTGDKADDADSDGAESDKPSGKVKQLPAQQNQSSQRRVDTTDHQHGQPTAYNKDDVLNAVSFIYGNNRFEMIASVNNLIEDGTIKPTYPTVAAIWKVILHRAQKYLGLDTDAVVKLLNTNSEDPIMKPVEWKGTYQEAWAKLQPPTVDMPIASGE